MSTRLHFTKLLNSFRCYLSYALSLFGRVQVRHMPTFLSVEPAAVCQLRCPACPVGLAKNHDASCIMHHASCINHKSLMPLSLWHQVLAEASPYVHTIQFFFQGEPLLHPDLPQMIHDAAAAGIYTIVSTNAQALTPAMAQQLVAAGLDRIIVSMDGLTKESYGAYRIGGSLEQTKAALRYLRNAKEAAHSHLLIELQCLRLRTNQHEWASFRRLYRELGADRLVFKTAQLYDYEQGHPLLPTNPRYTRYRLGRDGRYHLRRQPGILSPRRRVCFRLWSGAVITTQGEVLPCCYDKSHTHSFGTLAYPAHNGPIATIDSIAPIAPIPTIDPIDAIDPIAAIDPIPPVAPLLSLREAFHSPAADAFRHAVLRPNSSLYPAICRTCWS